MIVGFLGNIITVIPVIFMFDKIRNWYTRRKEKQGKTSKRNTRAVELFKKYGVIGSALLGPLLTGTHIAAFIGMSMGATKKRMMNWKIGRASCKERTKMWVVWGEVSDNSQHNR